MRLARGRVFGVGRRIFDVLGHRLAEAGLIDIPGDIHYLDIEELRWMLRATGTLPGGAHEVVRSRRELFAAYRSSPPPPDRFEAVGPRMQPAVGSGLAPTPGSTAGQLIGVGAAPGRVRAPIVVVRRPELAHDVAGRIVAARSTDPGWLPLMVSAAGLLVERGSLLSHSAIVARELRLPTIVGIPNLIERLHDGAVVEMDGSTGVVLLNGSTEER
jgi:pyruvate,water dikinase